MFYNLSSLQEGLNEIEKGVYEAFTQRCKKQFQNKFRVEES